MLLASVAGVLLIASIIVSVVLLRQQSSTDTTDTNPTNQVSTTVTTTTTAGETATNATTTNPVADSAVAPDDRSSIISIANSFIERYGSFSSDSNHENLQALRSFMTEALQQTSAKLENKADTNKEFYSITTQAVTATITDYSAGATGATVEVSTRRTETKGLAPSTYFNQTARLQLKKVAEAWKVDMVKWL